MITNARPDPLDLTAMLKQAGWDGKGGSCLNLGAGHCGSPISKQITQLPFDQLDNVEVFLPYFEELTRLSYEAAAVTNWHDDIFVWLEKHPVRRDFVLLIDIVEHFSVAQGMRLIHESIELANKAVLLWIPLGSCPQEPYDGNPYQKHLSTWDGGMVTMPFIDAAEVEFYFYDNFHGRADASWVIYKKVDDNE